MVKSLFTDIYSNSNMLAMCISLLFLFCLYLISYIPFFIMPNKTTKEMKRFAKNLTQKYCFGIIFIIISIVILPVFYCSVMSFFYLGCMTICLFGHINQSQKTIFISSALGMIFSGSIGFGLLVSNWLPS